MRVLYDHLIFEKQRYGGISRYFTQLMKAFAGTEFPDIETVCSVRYNMNEYLKNLMPDGSMVHCKGESRLVSAALWKLNQFRSECILSRGNYDVFHPTFYQPYVLRHLKKPMVCTVYDMTPEKFPWMFIQKLQSRLLNGDWLKAKREMALRADVIIAISQNTRQDLVEIYGIPEERIKVIYLGNTSLAAPTAVLPSFWDVPYVLYVGQRNSYKNFAMFCRAFSLLHPKHPDCRMLCAGGGAFSSEEQIMMQELKISDVARQRNLSNEELAAAYRGARFMIFPSLYEGFGLPILEAFDNSCPVLLANSSCFPEIGGEAAEYFNLDSLDSLVASMEHLYEDEAYRSRLVQKGRLRCRQFSWTKTAGETADVYRSLC